jgi:hypothetical protein
VDSKSAFVGYPPWPYLSTATPQNFISSLISLLSVVGQDTPEDTPASGLYTILQGNFREFPFHVLGCMAFSLHCFGIIDTIGNKAMGPALRS